jgi:cobyrinic acid a,c-diamide synthase
MYLGEKLALPEGEFPMAGVLPVIYGFSRKPQGHGYTVLRVECPNPYFPVGSEIRGHEFHYSRVTRWRGDPQSLVFRMLRGAGFYAGRDGLVYNNVLATYSHIHALGTPVWARALVQNASEYRNRRG